ncbi:SidA/IucD/PvdA family monooxygenase [Nocardia brasiliensis]|uniref:SidA/IucD/PvdA family monooxygenase n=1 Tax=Nocardia brasiliensis TaxID=37326 RepID=A0A6G9XTS9_NOCBR|nr:NAD(P)/FAD-dependent oxidoreductase [Nocardia brasiliensis]QIS04334.1 SidA/IucD/PvdA family monooxygenase [Nocardia brasiliensis]
MAEAVLRESAGSGTVTPDHEVVIVGAGFGGIAAAIALQKVGVDNVVILDKHDGVGGTWHVNTYPGVQVDIPSMVYSYSFDQRSDWSRVFAPGADLCKYANDVVDRHGLRPKVRLSRTVTQGEWDEDNQLWRVHTDAGEVYTARFLVPALGGIEVPKLPDITGIDSFAGQIMHTSRWDHDYDLRGKHVAVIGTGASALQLIPAIADTVEHLTVFQRRAIWIAPKPDWKAGAFTRFLLRRKAFRAPVRALIGGGVSVGTGAALLAGKRALPALKVAEATLRLWMRTQIHDRELREKLTPDYPFGCKRPSMSNEYFKTFTRDDVTLVTDLIDHGTERGLVTKDGTAHEFDAIVCATGFAVMGQGTTPGFPTFGRDGVELGKFWHENRFSSYQGVSVPGFPNLLMIVGPYGYAPSSYHCFVEATAAHAARVIKETLRRGATTCEVTQQAHDDFTQKCRDQIDKIGYVDLCTGSNTYYINYQGDVALIRPQSHLTMWWQSRFFPLNVYRYTRNTLDPVVADTISIDQKAGV